jgi:hypothetical protein
MVRYGVQGAAILQCGSLPEDGKAANCTEIARGVLYDSEAVGVRAILALD